MVMPENIVFYPEQERLRSQIVAGGSIGKPGRTLKRRPPTGYLRYRVAMRLKRSRGRERDSQSTFALDHFAEVV